MLWFDHPLALRKKNGWVYKLQAAKLLQLPHCISHPMTVNWSSSRNSLKRALVIFLTSYYNPHICLSITVFYGTNYIFYVGNRVYSSKFLVSTEVTLTKILSRGLTAKGCALAVLSATNLAGILTLPLIYLFNPGQVFLPTECEWQKFLPYSVVVRIKYQMLSSVFGRQ